MSINDKLVVSTEVSFQKNQGSCLGEFDFGLVMKSYCLSEGACDLFFTFVSQHNSS